MCALPPLLSYIFKANVAGFFEQKSMKNSANAGFRSDQVCLLVLSHQLFMDIPANLESLLWYKQEEINHSRWLTADAFVSLFRSYYCKDKTLNACVRYFFCIFV